MTDGTALLRSVLTFPTFPAEDTPRLVLADYLQEQGEHDRAEFVRVQVEIAYPTVGPDGTGDSDERYRLVRRERSLYHSNACDWHIWVPGAQQFVCHATEAVGTVFGDDLHIEQRFTRGFVSRIELPVAAFLAHAAAIFAAQPVTGVVLSDKRPQNTRHESRGTRRYTFWRDDGTRAGPAIVPEEMWLYPNARRKNFATELEATAAISEWCVTFGRKLAGLPTG